MSMKNAYVAKMEAQLKEWSGELSTFKARAEKAVAEGRIGYEQKLTASKAQHDVAAKKLEDSVLGGKVVRMPKRKAS